MISFVDVTKWVQADYRETQLTNVKVGDPAELRIDQYPGQLIRGKVLEIAPATGNFTKVVHRIPVKIARASHGLELSLLEHAEAWVEAPTACL